MPNLQHVSGLKELQAALKELPQRVGRNVLRGAVNSGAGVIRAEAQLLAPVMHEALPKHQPPGTLRRSIIVKHILEKSGDFRQTYYVTVRQGRKYQGQGKGGNLSQDAFYARWVEWGHYFVPPRPKGVNWKKHRSASQGDAARWVPAKPFMRPAFEAKKEAAVQAIKSYLAKRIPEEVAKLKGAQR